MILSVEVGTSTARAAGQVNVGKWSCTNLGGLGAARIATATANTAYEGVCQLAGTGEMRFYSSTANATSASGARTQLEVAPTSLWSGNSSGNITLSQSVANFTRVTIFFRDNDNVHSSVDVYDPLNKSVLLTSNWKGQFVKAKVVNLNGNQVNNYYYGQAATVNNTADDSNLIYITRVLGWKY